ncbi:uncharacterized protein JCM10292_000222 [Rhodotorula paludigena]|uniref:uncharacterized protein n=1 Tax=Rhodotorula paludigena TaxID=86838 RepID=UPI00317C6260
MDPPGSPATIQLATLSSTPASPTPFSQKDSFLDTFPGSKRSSSSPSADEPVVHKRRRFGWSEAETVLWATVPLVLFAVALATLAGALFSTGSKWAFLSVVEGNGTGRLDYHILNSCAVAAGSTKTRCTPYEMNNDFLPSLTTISPNLLGFSALQLPMYSRQTPSIFLTSFLFLVASLLVYLPLWTLAYFPRTRLVPPVAVRFMRYYASRLFALVGLLACLAFLFTLTIGVGYLLQLARYASDFAAAYRHGALSRGLPHEYVDPSWTAHLGGGFTLVWVSTAFSGLLVLAVQISLHNGLDERVEWPHGVADV